MLQDGKTALKNDHVSDISHDVQRLTDEANQSLIKLYDINLYEQVLNPLNEQNTKPLLTMCFLTTAFIVLIAFLQMDGLVTASRKRRRRRPHTDCKCKFPLIPVSNLE